MAAAAVWGRLLTAAGTPVADATVSWRLFPYGTVAYDPEGNQVADGGTPSAW